MALVDDIQNELAELIESAEEIRGQADTYLRQPDEEISPIEQARQRAEAVIQRMDEVLQRLQATDLSRTSVAEVSALIESAELALDQADEALDELDI